MNARKKNPSLRRHYLGFLWVLLAIVAIPLMLLAGCQSQFLYFPRPYPVGAVENWQKQASGKPIDFTTSQGRQRAFLQGNLKSPRHLWIFCGGNGTVALDWWSWIAENAPKEDAWLLVDFPGYGESEGSPSPERIRESLKTVVPLATRALGWSDPPDPARLRFFGHSLGSAACLLAASEFDIRQGVLLSPFTSTMEMTRVLTGLPLGFLVWHRFDNTARLAELAARGPGKVIILHGTDDEIIPFWMSQKLTNNQKSTVILREIPGGRHNTIPETHPTLLAAALEEAAGK